MTNTQSGEPSGSLRPQSSIRILLVDDHTSFRQSLAFMLDREDDIAVAAQAGSVADARGAIAATRQSGHLDVAIVDIGLPDGDGTDIVRILHNAGSKHRTRVLVLTGVSDRFRIARAVESGADAVLDKSVTLAAIVAAVRRLHAGEELLSARETIELLRFAALRREQDRAAQHALAQLTPREREVLGCLAEGLTDNEIAARLHVSGETVRTHMVNLLRKLNVDSRLQALVFAIRHGAVEIK
jgi:RNA polymerase sigma factor (sigma-70 family)